MEGLILVYQNGMSKKIYTTINNFLSKKDFTTIKNTIESENFPWYYNHKITDKTDDVEQGYFTHLFYDQHIPSHYFKCLKPLIDKLKVKSIIRIKANLYHKTEKLIFHKPHLDYDFKHKGAILYLNTCNGYTVLNGGTKIKSVENTLLLFDSSKTHNSTNCTDKKIRLNININYF